MRLQVCILTPDGIFQNETADELILPTRTGKMGVLIGHAPLITALDIGPIICRTNSNWTALTLMGGFALVQEDTVTVLVNEAEDVSSIDLQRAEKDLENATNRLNQVTQEKDKVEATLSFKRARARYQTVQIK